MCDVRLVKVDQILQLMRKVDCANFSPVLYLVSYPTNCSTPTLTTSIDIMVDIKY